MVKTEKPDWLKIKPAELEKLIIEIAKEEKKPSKIGIILRDKHGIPKSKLLGVKIKPVLKKAGITIISDKDIVISRIDNLKPHIEKHKHDYSAKRSLTKKLWAIRKLEKFA